MSIDDIYSAVLDFAEDEIPDLVAGEIAAGTSIGKILDEGLIAALDEVGEGFSEGRFFVPEMLLAADTMKAGLAVLRPHLVRAGVEPIGTIVLGTVKGDVHDIGKNLVGIMLEGAGFRVVDIGVDASSPDFIAAAQENDADLIGLSALLTTSMPVMQDTVAAIAEAVRSRNLNVVTIVGGAPITEEFALRIGADAFGLDAHSAVSKARALVDGLNSGLS